MYVYIICCDLSLSNAGIYPYTCTWVTCTVWWWYIYIYICMYHHHTVQVTQVQVWFLRQWMDEKAPPAQVAEGDITTCASGLSVLVAEKDHHQHKLQLVTTTTCASGMFAPVQRRETPQAQGAKARASISVS